jgi:predicted SAM-dependent methyltransferase
MDYSFAFHKRAKQYIDTVTKFPHVLENEFKTAVSMLQLNDRDILLNIPSGGVYIQPYLPSTIQYKKLEINPSFAMYDTTSLCFLNKIPYPNEFFTKILSLAALHHTSTEERLEFYRECFRLLKPSGMLVIGDVRKGTSQDIWLNQIVNTYNSNGHHGVFFTEDDAELMKRAGFHVQTSVQTYTWKFTSELEMIEFFKTLMHLDLIDTDSLKKLVYETFVVDMYNVQWELIYFCCTKP